EEGKSEVCDEEGGGTIPAEEHRLPDQAWLPDSPRDAIPCRYERLPLRQPAFASLSRARAVQPEGGGPVARGSRGRKRRQPSQPLAAPGAGELVPDVYRSRGPGSSCCSGCLSHDPRQESNARSAALWLPPIGGAATGRSWCWRTGTGRLSIPRPWIIVLQWVPEP